MAVDAHDMALVHRVFRREFHDLPALIATVRAGDTARAKVVGDHLQFLVDALHHHHAAEDELGWPPLLGRVPEHTAVIERMAVEHAHIAEAVTRTQPLLTEWRARADPAVADELSSCVAELTTRVGEHLDDEERNAVPIIENHLTPDEWQAALKRGAAFLSSHPWLGIVLGGLVLDYAAPDERQKFLAGVPLPQRMLVRLFSARITAAYRRRLYDTPNRRSR
jgi:hemerythrin-like domain-containing protein